MRAIPNNGTGLKPIGPEPKSQSRRNSSARTTHTATFHVFIYNWLISKSDTNQRVTHHPNHSLPSVLFPTCYGRLSSIVSKPPIAAGVFIPLPTMDFRIDNNVNGEVLGNSVEVEVETRDEVEFGNDTGGSSIEGAFQLGQYENNNQDPGEREMDTSLNGDEPYVGQEFDSESAAHAFYNAHATRLGFVIRVSKLSRSRRDGSAIGRALVCNKEGYRSADRREKVVRQRAETRVGCRAMILVRKINSGKWVVTKFESEHTHALSPGKCRRDLIYDQFPNEHDKIRELSQQLATEKKRAASYKRHLEMIFQHIEEHNEGLARKVQHIVDSVKELECKEQQNHI